MIRTSVLHFFFLCLCFAQQSFAAISAEEIARHLDTKLNVTNSSADRSKLVVAAYKEIKNSPASYEERALFLRRYAQEIDIEKATNELFEVAPETVIRLLSHPRWYESEQFIAWLERALIWADSNALHPQFMPKTKVDLFAKETQAESIHVSLARLLTEPQLRLPVYLVRSLMSQTAAVDWFYLEGRDNVFLSRTYSKLIRDYLNEKHSEPTDFALYPIQRTRPLVANPKGIDIEAETEKLFKDCPVCVARIMGQDAWIAHPKFQTWITRLFFYGQTHRDMDLGEVTFVHIAKLMTNPKISLSRDQVQMLMKHPDVQAWFARVGFKNEVLMRKYESMILDFFQFNSTREIDMVPTTNLVRMLKDPAILKHLRFVEFVISARGGNNSRYEREILEDFRLPFWSKSEVLKDYIHQSLPQTLWGQSRDTSAEFTGPRFIQALRNRSLTLYLDYLQLQMPAVHCHSVLL